MNFIWDRWLWRGRCLVVPYHTIRIHVKEHSEWTRAPHTHCTYVHTHTHTHTHTRVEELTEHSRTCTGTYVSDPGQDRSTTKQRILPSSATVHAAICPWMSVSNGSWSAPVVPSPTVACMKWTFVSLFSALLCVQYLTNQLLNEMWLNPFHFGSETCVHLLGCKTRLKSRFLASF